MLRSRIASTALAGALLLGIAFSAGAANAEGTQYLKASLVKPPLPYTAPSSCGAPFVNSPLPLHLRLGLTLTPNVDFDGGLDVIVPGLHLLPQLKTRVDLDVLAGVNFKGISTMVPLTFDQVYTPSLTGVSGFYFGGGIGPFFGNNVHFGGKVFAGASLTNRLGIEGDAYFDDQGDTVLGLMLRVAI